MTDSSEDGESRRALAELDGVTVDSDGRARAKMTKNAKGGKASDDE